MADSKITALTAISTVDPTADPLVIVDVSDTSMAASGTTKKSTINQLLGSGGTATLASATITGAATAASLTVTGSSIPTNGLYLPTTNTLEFAANSLAQYRIAPLGVFTWYDGAGGTRMTLNSTGLGVGVVPSLYRFEVGSGSTDTRALFTSNNAFSIGVKNGANQLGGWIGSAGNNILTFSGNDGTMKVTIDNTGNVGVGVTPSAWSSTWKAIQVGAIGSLSYSPDDTGYTISTSNGYWNGSNWIRIAAAAVSAYSQNQGKHSWLSAASSSAGSTIAFGDAKMTLDASGNLILLSSNTPATLTTNGQLTVNATSDTNLRFSYRGSDGVTRTANLTLAP